MVDEAIRKILAESRLGYDGLYDDNEITMAVLGILQWRNIPIKKTNLPMSFCATIAQMYGRTKRETRRLGWDDVRLQVGNIIWAVEKSQGRKCIKLSNGTKLVEPLLRIWPLLITHKRKERLNLINKQACIDEGFSDYSPDDFVKKFLLINKKCKPDQLVNVIRFSFIEYQGLLDGHEHLMPHESYEASFSGEMPFSPVTDGYDPRYNKINSSISRVLGLNDRQWKSYQSDLIRLGDWQKNNGG